MWLGVLSAGRLCTFGEVACHVLSVAAVCGHAHMCISIHGCLDVNVNEVSVLC